MYKRFTTVLIPLALTLAAVSTEAASLPDYYPKSFDQQGIVSSLHGRELSVNAQRYRLDANVRIHTLDTRFASPRSLASGKEVGFNTSPGKRGVNKITEIWLLPDGTVELP